MDNILYLEDLDLRPGLFGLSTDPVHWFAKATNFVCNITSQDERSEYSHSWMVHDSSGTTFEQGWKLGHKHMTKYIDQKILIFSHEEITEQAYLEFYKEHWAPKVGRFYPPMRLLLFAFPPYVRRKVYFGLKVCSETTSTILEHYGVIDSCLGVSPDIQHEWALYWKGFTIEYEGVLKSRGEGSK